MAAPNVKDIQDSSVATPSENNLTNMVSSVVMASHGSRPSPRNVKVRAMQHTSQNMNVTSKKNDNKVGIPIKSSKNFMTVGNSPGRHFI